MGRTSELDNTSKKLYYTKCNKVFHKNSTSEVTGYEYDPNDKKCLICPFAEFQNRSRAGTLVNIPECRAGSKKPNHHNDYSTININDSSNLNIKSLQWDWIETLRSDILNIEGVQFSGYTQDLSDCRKDLSITFYKNKKGIAAKKNIINKYFEKVGESQLGKGGVAIVDDNKANETRSGIISKFEDYQNESELPTEDIDIDLLVPSTLNKYKMIDIEKMAEAIKDVGLLQPLTVELVNINGMFKYIILNGERRYRGALLANKKTLPCIVKENLSDNERMKILILANGHRENDNETKLWEVEQLQILYKDQKERGNKLGARMKDLIADDLKISNTQAQRLMNITNKLIPELKESYAAKEITLVEAESLSKTSEDQQIAYYNNLQMRLQQPKIKKEKVVKVNNGKEINSNIVEIEPGQYEVNSKSEIKEFVPVIVPIQNDFKVELKDLQEKYDSLNRQFDLQVSKSDRLQNELEKLKSKKGIITKKIDLSIAISILDNAWSCEVDNDKAESLNKQINYIKSLV